jgi:hypothetical protein
VLPNLIVIGAARCGTTSLHRYLDLHPQIFMSVHKELNFFAPERNWHRGLAWYESQFRRPADVLGESSPCYTRHPAVSDVPERMASIVPDAKLIYLVRDPLKRVVSDYLFSRWVVDIPLPEGDVALADFDRSPHVMSSRYATQLERYLPHYPLERILVVDTADLRTKRPETLARIFRFLGVDESFVSPDFTIEHNALEQDRLTKSARAFANVLDRTIGEHRARQLRASIPRSLQRPLTRRSHARTVELGEPLRSRLTACLKEEADRLRALTGQRFEGWSV